MEKDNCNSNEFKKITTKNNSGKKVNLYNDETNNVSSNNIAKDIIIVEQEKSGAVNENKNPTKKPSQEKINESIYIKNDEIDQNSSNFINFHIKIKRIFK